MSNKNVGQLLREGEEAIMEVCRTLHIDREPYDFGPALSKKIALGIDALIAEKQQLRKELGHA